MRKRCSSSFSNPGLHRDSRALARILSACSCVIKSLSKGTVVVVCRCGDNDKRAGFSLNLFLSCLISKIGSSFEGFPCFFQRNSNQRFCCSLVNKSDFSSQYLITSFLRVFPLRVSFPLFSLRAFLFLFLRFFLKALLFQL